MLSKKAIGSNYTQVINAKTLTLAPQPPPPPPNKTLNFHKISTLLLTFVAYASFHASRKPPSIVKSLLTTWAPFDGPTGPHRLGELDLAFLSAYAAGMYLSGHIGDRIDLRVFLTIGMMGSGFFTVLFGLGYFFDVHALGFFVIVQICCGLFQSIGWPCVVSVVGNWFGKSKRGLIMGVWNSNTSVGNIVGSVVASSVLGFGWGWSFVLPGVSIVVVGVLVFLFLVVSPENVGLELEAKEVEVNVEGIPLVVSEKVEEGEVGLARSENADSLGAIGFLEAWRLPNVAAFAFCLFFSKLVAYTFLYWLPFYIRNTGSPFLPTSDFDV